jgi:hypothetical protein
VYLSYNDGKNLILWFSIKRSMSMTKLDTIKILNLIEKVYPSVTFKSETILNWLTKCESMDYSMVLRKIALHMRDNPYPPTLKGMIGKSCLEGTYFEWLDEYSIRPVEK